MNFISILRSLLKEAILKKDKMNKYGAFKSMYDLNTRPDLIVKVWKEKDDYMAKDEYNTFKKYPDLFARIEKINFERRYMVQERLDTDRVHKDFKVMEKLLYVPYFNKFLEQVISKISESDDEKFVNAYDNFSQKDKDTLLRYLKFFRKVRDIDTKSDKDTNPGNMGYDKKGNLKLLDI
jgi:hypothetical protein